MESYSPSAQSQSRSQSHSSSADPFFPEHDLTSFLPPSYTPNLGNDEHSAEYTPNGTYTHSSGDMTLVLANQEENSPVPSYGAHAPVVGTLQIGNRDSIVEVVFKFEGKLKVRLSGRGTASHSEKIMDHRYTFWKHDGHGSTCPVEIPFSFKIPSSIETAEETVFLPPSYEVLCPGVTEIRIIWAYALTIIIRRTGFLAQSKSLSTYINYQPRTRPDRPVPPLIGAFDSLEAPSSEWYDAATSIRPRSTAHSTLNPIDCHFYVPAVRTFGLRDTIPFHIRLIGSLDSLREFLPPLPAQSPSSVSAQSGSSLRSNGGTSRFSLQRDLDVDLAQSSFKVEVTLTRRVSVGLAKGNEALGSMRLGEAVIRSLPPHVGASITYTPGAEVSVDWEGEIRCRDDLRINTGEYNIGDVAIQDYLILKILPHRWFASPFKIVEEGVSIRLVTDTWLDTSGSDERLGYL